MNISKLISDITLDKVNCIIPSFEGKVVLVTGATGMIGQNIVALLLALNDRRNANIKIIAHFRNQEKANDVFSCYAGRDDISYLVCDIKELCIDAVVDYIIHTANITGGSKQHLDFPMRTISTTLESGKRVLDFAKKTNAAVIYLSSLEVYGYTGTESENLKETDGGYIDCTNPRSSYSESKRMCECMFAAYAKEFGVNATIARLTATFGRGVSKTDQRVFAQFAKSILANQDIILKSTGGTIRNYCDAEDVATALLFILAKGEKGQAYNIANMNTIISIKQMAEMFIAQYPNGVSKLVLDIGTDATKYGYNKEMRNVLDSSKLMELGWQPVHDMKAMIKHLIVSMR